tara:strand:+ start:709 stop:1287 length:579 start_codon:yes stop_codon:yes gene_type:complete
MLINDVFKSIIAIDYLNIDNNVLEEFCKKQVEITEKEKKHDLSQSSHIDIRRPELAELLKLTQEKLNLLHNEMGLSNEYYQKIIEVWANVDTPNEIVIPHQHATSAFSCVYYVKGDINSGNLEFVNPNNAHPWTIDKKHITHYNSFTSNTFHTEPVSGKLVIFPSWLYHYVYPNKSKTQRISIAFNTQFEKR